METGANQQLTPLERETRAAIRAEANAHHLKNHGPQTLHSKLPPPTAPPPGLFPPLNSVTKPTVPTDEAAYYLNRKPQTLRAWACLENGPLRPVRINGRLAWSVSAIRALVNGEAK